MMGIEWSKWSDKQIEATFQLAGFFAVAAYGGALQSNHIMDAFILLVAVVFLLLFYYRLLQIHKRKG